MNRRSVTLWLLIALGLVAFPCRSPAPLVYRPGEGWTYEPVGGEGKWRRPRAKEQLEVAQAAFDKKDYNLALKAARHVVRGWPLSDYMPQAQYLVGRCYEAKGQPERAFKEYQRLLEQHPKFGGYQEILHRQYGIANLYLAGKWFRLWTYIPLPPSAGRTAQMYEKIVKNGPYSDVAPEAQLKLGTAREKQKDFPAAAKAFELAADRYHDRPKIAAEALFRQGQAYNRQALRADYDQSTAGQAIAAFTDFTTLYPADPRVSRATNTISALKKTQALGCLQIARFYENAKFYTKAARWKGARTYYNEVVLLDPSSEYAELARKRIDALNKLLKDANK
ncbi:MAG: outer membrane protein assembly factor BamD [Verrucomicrobiota bacterium]|jgi:outer membrane protein assembly factor BamD